MTTVGNQICSNIFDAKNTSHNLRIDKEEGTKKRSHSSRAKASEEAEEHSSCKHQKLRNSFCRNKSQIQEKRKVREISRSESSEDDEQFSSRNDDNAVDSLCHQKMKWIENKRIACFTSEFQQRRASIQRLH